MEVHVKIRQILSKEPIQALREWLIKRLFASVCLVTLCGVPMVEVCWEVSIDVYIQFRSVFTVLILAEAASFIIDEGLSVVVRDVEHSGKITRNGKLFWMQVLKPMQAHLSCGYFPCVDIAEDHCVEFFWTRLSYFDIVVLWRLDAGLLDEGIIYGSECIYDLFDFAVSVIPLSLWIGQSHSLSNRKTDEQDHQKRGEHRAINFRNIQLQNY